MAVSRKATMALYLFSVLSCADGTNNIRAGRRRETSIEDLKDLIAGNDGNVISSVVGANELSSLANPTENKRPSSGSSVPNYSEDGSSQATNRIINGQAANTNQFSWYAGILTVTSSGVTSFAGCGATLIHDDVFVTAAHCVEKVYAVNQLYVGMNSPWSPNSQQVRMKIDVATIIVHPDYDPDTKAHDLALIKTVKPVNYYIKRKFGDSRSIDPIELITQQHYNNIKYTSGQFPLKVVGFGTTNAAVNSNSQKLMWTTVDFYSDTSCKSLLESVDKTVVTSDDMLCAYRKGTDACNGDSGGPLIFSDGNTPYLIG
eukprot:scaffold51740_cov54-Attheya_sp.AAC.1